MYLFFNSQLYYILYIFRITCKKHWDLVIMHFLRNKLLSLLHTVKAFGCFLPEDHPLYVTHWRSVRNISVCEIGRELECYKLCCRVEAIELTSQLFHHVIPVNEDPLQACKQGEQFHNKGFWKSKGLPSHVWKRIRGRCMPAKFAVPGFLKKDHKIKRKAALQTHQYQNWSRKN